MAHSAEQMAIWAKEKEEKQNKRFQELKEQEEFNKRQKLRKQEFSNKIGELGTSKHFTDQEKNTVKMYLEHGDHKGADAEARFHTISALERHFKKNKIPLEKISKSKNDSSKSIYPNIDGKVIRISDHELPETEQRLHNRQQGLTGKWDKEIIVNDWQNKDLNDYLKEIHSKDD